MTLKNFIDLMTNANEIDTIVAIDNDNEAVAQFGYHKAKTIEEYTEWWLDNDKTLTEIEMKELVSEYIEFLSHLNSEVVKIELEDRYIYVRYNDLGARA